jgi:hypothetical protein
MKPCRKRLYRHCSALYVCQRALQAPGAHPGSRCSVAGHGPVFNMCETYLILIKQRYPYRVGHRRDSLTVSSKIKHARESRLPCPSG